MEPEVNSYILTIDIKGIKKQTALEIADALEEGLEAIWDAKLLQGFRIVTAHVKDVR